MVLVRHGLSVTSEVFAMFCYQQSTPLHSLPVLWVCMTVLHKVSFHTSTTVKKGLFMTSTIPQWPIKNNNKKAVLSQRWPRYISRSWAVVRYGHSKLSKITAAAIFNLFESKIAPLDPPSPKTPPYNQTWSGSDHPLQRYGHSRMLGHMKRQF